MNNHLLKNDRSKLGEMELLRADTQPAGVSCPAWSVSLGIGDCGQGFQETLEGPCVMEMTDEHSTGCGITTLWPLTATYCVLLCLFQS